MRELEFQIKKALEVVQKLNGNLPDDTYLDKFVSGIDEKTKSLEASGEFEAFLTEAAIDDFCAQNFPGDGSEEIQNFTFKLCSFATSRSLTWTARCTKLLMTRSKWPTGSTSFLLLLSNIFGSKDLAEEVFEQTWNNVLASVVLCENSEKSHFWRNASKLLIAKFMLNLLGKLAENPEFLKTIFESRICVVFREKIESCLVLNEAIKEVSRDLQHIHMENMKRIFPDFDSLPLEAQIRLKILVNPNQKDLSNFLCDKYETRKDDKSWINSLKILHEKVPTSSSFALEEKCLELSLQDHKLIQNMAAINSKNLASKLWNLIFESYLQSFINDPDSLIVRDLNDSKDAKMLISLFSSLNALMSKVERMSDCQWTILTKLTMIAELDPMTRSTILDLIKKLLDCEKLVNISLETLASQLWHLLRYYDWETRDAILFCFSSEKVNIAGESIPKAVVGLVKSSLSNDSSFVRKASICLLSKLWKIQPGILSGIHQKFEAILLNETEAIVRRQAALFIKDRLDDNDSKTVELMLLATKDLDWEVKQISFEFWRASFDKKFRNGKYDNFDEFVRILNRNRILDGLQLVSKDYEKALQNECYLFLKMAKSRIMKKFPKLTRENLVLDDAKRPKLESRDFLVDFLFDHDLEGRVRDYNEYCEKHYGLTSILDDIIHLDSGQEKSQIDTIDCF